MTAVSESAPRRHAGRGGPASCTYTPVHRETPLTYSEPLSRSSGHHIWVKQEFKQVTGSFKARGIGRACWDAVQRIGPDAHLVVASGGNAGLAAAYSARQLGVKCTVFCHSATEPAIYKRIQADGAEVDLSNPAWEQVDAAALAFAAAAPNRQYVHPFIGESLVVGHVSLIDELYDQLPALARERGLDIPAGPDVVTVAVGGGGLLRGILRGLDENAKRVETPSAHVIGVQTLGGDSWVRSLESEDEFVILQHPDSQAKSLVCKAGSTEAVRDARHYASTGEGGVAPNDTKGKAGRYLTALRVDDAQAGAAAWKASDEFGHPIELSCGAAMVPAYQPAILDAVSRKIDSNRPLHVVLVACGGSRVNDELVNEFRTKYGDGFGDIFVDGEKVTPREAAASA